MYNQLLDALGKLPFITHRSALSIYVSIRIQSLLIV